MRGERPDHGVNAADRVQIELIRRSTVGQRVARMRSLSADVIEMSRRALRKRHPDWSEREILLEWAAIHYGRDLADKLRRYLSERES